MLHGASATLYTWLEPQVHVMADESSLTSPSAGVYLLHHFVSAGWQCGFSKPPIARAVGRNAMLLLLLLLLVASPCAKAYQNVQGCGAPRAKKQGVTVAQLAAESKQMALQQPVIARFEASGSVSAQLSSARSKFQLSVHALAENDHQLRTAASQSSKHTEELSLNEQQSSQLPWQPGSASRSSEQFDDGQKSCTMSDRSYFDHDAGKKEDLCTKPYDQVHEPKGICCSHADAGLCVIEGPEGATAAATSHAVHSNAERLSTAAQALLSRSATAPAALSFAVQQQQCACLQQYEALQLQQQQCFEALANIPAVTAAAAAPALVTAARFFTALSSSGALRCCCTSGGRDVYSAAEQQQQQQQQQQTQQGYRSYGVRLFEVGEAFGRSATHTADVAVGDSPSNRCIMAAGENFMFVL
jgi:hypothetical protein